MSSVVVPRNICTSIEAVFPSGDSLNVARSPVSPRTILRVFSNILSVISRARSCVSAIACSFQYEQPTRQRLDGSPHRVVTTIATIIATNAGFGPGELTATSPMIWLVFGLIGAGVAWLSVGLVGAVIQGVAPYKSPPAMEPRGAHRES